MDQGLHIPGVGELVAKYSHATPLGEPAMKHVLFVPPEASGGMGPCYPQQQSLTNTPFLGFLLLPMSFPPVPCQCF